MSKALTILLMSGGVLVVAIAAPIIAFAAFPLLWGVVFGSTLDWRLIALILLFALLPGGIGIGLFAYFLLRSALRWFAPPPDAERDYFRRYLSGK